MTNSYQIDLYKSGEFIRSTVMTITDSTFSLTEAANEARKLMLVGGYDRDYDCFSCSIDGDEKIYMDLIEVLV